MSESTMPLTKRPMAYSFRHTMRGERTGDAMYTSSSACSKSESAFKRDASSSSFAVVFVASKVSKLSRAAARLVEI